MTEVVRIEMSGKGFAFIVHPQTEMVYVYDNDDESTDNCLNPAICF